MPLRSRPLRALLPALLASAAPLILTGCGSAWRDVPVASVDESTQALGGQARFTLNDRRVIELRVSQFKYPWVEGERLVGEWTNGRTLRVDLRQVSRIEIRDAEG
jgi:hypothetical protein